MTLTWNIFTKYVLRVILIGVRDPIHTDSLALFAFNIVALRANPIQEKITSKCTYIKYFEFNLTCDVTGDTEINEICFPSIVFPGLSNAA